MTDLIDLIECAEHMLTWQRPRIAAVVLQLEKASATKVQKVCAPKRYGGQ